MDNRNTNIYYVKLRYVENLLHCSAIKCNKSVNTTHMLHTKKIY